MPSPLRRSRRCRCLYFRAAIRSGCFFTGLLAALSMTFIRHITRLREDAVIGFIFLLFCFWSVAGFPLNPTAVNVQTIILGNILGIADEDVSASRYHYWCLFFLFYFVCGKIY